MAIAESVSYGLFLICAPALSSSSIRANKTEGIAAEQPGASGVMRAITGFSVEHFTSPASSTAHAMLHAIDLQRQPRENSRQPLCQTEGSIGPPPPVTKPGPCSKRAILASIWSLAALQRLSPQTPPGAFDREGSIFRSSPEV